MKRRVLFLLLILLAFGWPESGSCGKPPQGLLTYYTTEQGLSSNAVFGIHCDRDGFLWFFTWNGISRHDGYRFVNYGTAQQQQPLVHNRIDSGFEDRHANFWVVTYTHNLYRFDRHTEEFEGIDRFLPEGVRPNISHVTEAPDGTVWAVVPDYGIVGLATDSTTRQLIPTLYRQEFSGPVELLYADATGLVWFTQQNRLFSISAAEQSLYCELQLDGQTTFTTVQGDQQTICFGTSDGRIILRDVHTQRFLEQQLPVREAITSIEPDEKGAGSLLIGTATGRFGRFDGTDFRPLLQCADPVVRIMRDSYGMIWLLTTGTGLYNYDPATGASKHFTEGAIPDRAHLNNGTVIEHNGETWLRLNGGGMLWYDRSTGTAHRFYDLNESTDGAWTFSCFDRQGDLWATTTNRGVVRIRFTDPRVQSLPLPQPDLRPGRMLFADHLDGLWVSLREGGVIRYEADREHSRIYLRDDEDRLLDQIYVMAENPDGTLWFGTRHEGLYLAQRLADGRLHTLAHYDYDEADPYSLSNNKVHAILTDSRDRIWIATYGGGICLLDRQGDSVRFLSQRNRFRDRLPAQCNKVRTLCEDADGRIWAGTSEGIVLLDYDSESGRLDVEQLRRDPDDPHSLLNNDIVNIYRDLSNRMWIGTHGGGLNRYTGRDPRTGAAQWISYIESNGHLYSDIRSIIGNGDGSLRIATDLHLCTFDPETGQFIPLTQQDGLFSSREFLENAAVRDRAGRTYITEQHTLYYSEAQDPADRPDSLHLRITGFSIDGQPAKPSAAARAPLRTAITEAGEVRIGRRNHTFSFTFAALNRHRQQNLRYRYQLEGYDHAWVDDDGSCEARYANVPGGHYRFHVLAFLPQAPDAAEEVVIDCYVATTWRSSWRGLLIGLAALILIGSLGLSYRNIYRRALSSRRAVHIATDQIALNDTQDEDFMLTVVKYLEQHYADSGLKVEDLARQTNVSRSSFYNRIKELTQMTPSEYLKHFRLRKAESYLLETQLPISEIAYRTGFTDPAYFTMCFRTNYGITPSAYRKRNSRS